MINFVLSSVACWIFSIYFADCGNLLHVKYIFGQNTELVGVCLPSHMNETLVYLPRLLGPQLQPLVPWHWLDNSSHGYCLEMEQVVCGRYSDKEYRQSRCQGLTSFFFVKWFVDRDLHGS